MTEFEKLISKYTDAEQYLKTAGYFHVAVHAWEAETRKLIDAIVEREGYGEGLEKIKAPSAFLSDRTTYADKDRENIAYAIPHRYYSQKDGNIEVDSVDVIWFTYSFEDEEHRHPTDGDETVIPITEDDESRLMELTHLYDNARKDFEAVKRTAVINLFDTNGIKTGEFTRRLETVQDFANGLIEAVTKEDAKHLQEIQHDQITTLEGIGDDTRAELLRLYCPEHVEADDKTKAICTACAYSNFAHNYITAIPESYLSEPYITAYGKTESTEEEEQRRKQIRDAHHSIDEKTADLALKWYYEIGGEYVQDEEETPAEDVKKPTQSEVVIKGSYQDYFIPSIYTQDITKPRVIFDNKYSLDELDGTQLELDILPNSNKDCFVYVSMSIEASDDIKLTAKPTTFDKAVLDGINSIYDTGQIVFTAKQVANLVYHGNNLKGSGISPNQIGAVTKSINKLRNIEISIDWTEHARANGLPDGIRYTRRDHIIPASVDTLTRGKEVLEWYTLRDEPPLFTYAKQVKQINSVPIGILDIPTKMDSEKVALRNYLIEQIGIMKNPNNKNFSRNITINKLLAYAGINADTITKQVRSKKIKTVETMLMQFRAENWIKGYEFIKEGRALHAIKIIL